MSAPPPDGHEPALWQRVWLRDRVALGLVAVVSAAAGVLWRFTTRPMGDTPGYRAAAAGLRAGWPGLLDRTPGYPLLLLVTGSSDRSTVVLFLVQLGMHAFSVVLVLDALRFVGIGRRGRIGAAVLLMAPPVLLPAVYEGTEALSALLVTVVLWLLVVPQRRPVGHRRVLEIGTACGALAMVRPTFMLLFVPVAVVWAWSRRPVRADPVGLALLAAPSVLLVGTLTVWNGVRFDSYGLTPMLPYHLSSRTGPYVQELPAAYEPARSVLVAARDRALLRGRSMAPDNFIWSARGELERVTGLKGPALDRYVMAMDLELIVHNPFGYLDTVREALGNITTMDSEPAILGLGRPVAWVEQSVHLALSLLFLAAVATLPGLALARRLSGRVLRLLAAASVLVGYTVAVSVMVESGTARLRAPVDPTLVAVLVVAIAAARAEIGWSEPALAGRRRGKNDQLPSRGS